MCSGMEISAVQGTYKRPMGHIAHLNSINKIGQNLLIKYTSLLVHKKSKINYWIHISPPRMWSILYLEPFFQLLSSLEKGCSHSIKQWLCGSGEEDFVSWQRFCTILLLQVSHSRSIHWTNFSSLKHALCLVWWKFAIFSFGITLKCKQVYVNDTVDFNEDNCRQWTNLNQKS